MDGWAQMVLRETDFPSRDEGPGSALAALALLVDRSWRDTGPHADACARRFLGIVKVVIHQEDDIKLRAAELLSYCRARNTHAAGYSSWPALVRERSPWKATRTSEYVLFVRSGLDVIKQARSNHEIDLTTAIAALRTLGDNASAEEQLRWLREEARRDPDLPSLERLAGEDKRCVLEARKLGAILVGGHPPESVVDDFLVDCHHRELTCDQMVGTARESPAVPARLTEVVPEWTCDPAEGLLGPRIEPTGLCDALAQIDALTVILAKRRVLLGLACDLIRYRALWTAVPGCDSLEELCVVHLGISLRSLQRYAKDGLLHVWHPEVRKEVEAGTLTFDRANFALERGGTSDVSLQSWLELVRQLGTTELHHAAKERDGDLRKLYGPALALARSVRERLLRAPGTTTTEATGIESTAALVAEHLRRVGARGPIQVALRDRSHQRSPPPKPGYLYVRPKVLAAARYVLAVVVLPPLYGPRRTVGADRYTCQSPRCRRRTLRVQPHHIHQRQHGGSDDPANLVTLCPGCHQRGVHGGNMHVVRIRDFLVWTWPGGGVDLMYSPVHELVVERANGQRAGPRTQIVPGAVAPATDAARAAQSA